MGGTVAVAASPSSTAGDVGLGISVGTGISVGDEGTAAEALGSADIKPPEACLSPGRTGLTISRLLTDGAVAVSAGTAVGTSTVPCSVSCSSPGDVGDGSSVGTGISVGEEGAPEALRPDDAIADEPGLTRAGASEP